MNVKTPKNGRRADSRHKNKYLLVIFITVFLLVLFIGRSLKIPSESVVRPKCTRLAITKLYQTYDPSQLITTDHVFIIQNVLGHLLEVGAENTLIAGIAESWSIDTSKRTYEIKLSKNAKFSDGTPILARDVIATIKRHLLYLGTHMDMRTKIVGAAGFKNMEEEVSGLRLINDRLFSISLTRPDERFLYWLAFPELGILKEAEARKKVGDINFAISSGAFTTERMVDRIILKKNPHFYFKHGDAANCIEVMGVEDPESLVKLFESGNLDLSDYGATLSPSFDFVSKDPRYETLIGESKALIYFIPNPKGEVMNSSEKRRWFRNRLHGSDFTAYGAGKIFKETRQFLVESHQGFLSPAEIAKSVIGAESKPESSKIKILYPNVFGDKYASFLIEAFRKSTGINPTLVTYNEGNMLDALKDPTWDLLFFVVGMGEKATEVLLNYHFGERSPIYPWIDPLIDSEMISLRNSSSETDRLLNFKKISERLLEQALVFPLAEFSWPIFINKALEFKASTNFQLTHPLWSLSWKD